MYEDLLLMILFYVYDDQSQGHHQSVGDITLSSAKTFISERATNDKSAWDIEVTYEMSLQYECSFKTYFSEYAVYMFTSTQAGTDICDYC